jgi:inosose dehydratase
MPPASRDDGNEREKEREGTNSMTVADRRVHLGTDLITFFNTAYWGLGDDILYTDWIAAVNEKPRFYLDRMLDGARDAGLEGIELAPEPVGWRTFLTAYGDVAGVKQALAERGFAVGSSYSHAANSVVAAIQGDNSVEAAADGDIAEHAAFIGELGCHTIVMGNVARELFAGGFDGDVPADASQKVADQLNRLGRVAAREGARIAIHTDAYSVCSRNRDVDTIMELTDPAAVGLCLDAGHVTLDGGDAVEMLRKHVGRTPVMHWKDCVGPLHPGGLHGPKMEQHKVMLTYFRVLGSGTVDWHEWERILRDANWTGWAQAEIDMSPDPVGEIRQGLDYFERELAPIYA